MEHLVDFSFPSVSHSDMSSAIRFDEESLTEWRVYRLPVSLDLHFNRYSGGILDVSGLDPNKVNHVHRSIIQ